ncbi:putative cyclophilin-type peptidyl-prolyl cis-trans isomerase domain-containing protein [Plasmopara halstedii]
MEDHIAVALYDSKISKPEDYQFSSLLRSDFTMCVVNKLPNINLLFKCNAALLKDPFGNVLWPKDWMTQVLPPNEVDRWYYIIHERVQPKPQDDLQDQLYAGGALLILAFVPSECESIDIKTWLLYGITQEYQPLLRLKARMATLRQMLERLHKKPNTLLEIDQIESHQQQIETQSKNSENVTNARLKELTDEISNLERRCRRITRLLMTEPVTMVEVSRMAGSLSNNFNDEVETRTWAATFKSPRGRDLASLALNKTDWRYVCLLQTRPTPRAFFEDDQLSNQTINSEDLLKEVNMRTVLLRRLRHGEGELIVLSNTAEQNDGHPNPVDKTFHYSSIGGMYSGAFRLGQKQGRGQEYSNVGIYNGDYEGNTRCGDGKLIYGKGTVCQGTFDRPQRCYEHNDKLRGRVLKRSLLNGDDFRDGTENGKEMHVKFPDGATYDGEMQDGMITGHGRYVSSTGVIDEGLFDKGVLHGPVCKRTFSDGSFEEGPFREGQLHGRGRQRGRHGEFYEGFFENGARHGRGITWFRGGSSKHVGFWHDDAMEGRGDLYYCHHDNNSINNERMNNSSERVEKWDFWYEGEFMQNETRSRHRLEDLRGLNKHQSSIDHIKYHVPFTTNGKSRERMPFLTTELPHQLEKWRRRKKLNGKRRMERERAYLQQCEINNLSMYYALLDDFCEEWTNRKRNDYEDTLLSGDELRRVQEKREALRAVKEQREKSRAETYCLSPRKKSLAKFEEYLRPVTLIEHLEWERAKGLTMSNIYITEPNTEGKVLLHTSFGDLDVELWPHQAPKACRNFVQLCLEGYYDQTIFHRVIAGFMVQGGDPTGTGKSGESIYGGAFIDEFHSRLKFNHRGLLAMANENKVNTNHSQFFFTLDACEFLNRKNTIFGKVTGNTIFNLLSVGDIETDAQDRPINPPKLLSVEVLWNPFEDIVPRAKVQNVILTEEDALQKKKRERKATRDLKLLSFGDEEKDLEDESHGGVKQAVRKKVKTMMSSHDLLDDRKLKLEVDAEVLQRINKTSEKATAETKNEQALANLKAAVTAAANKTSQSTESSNEQNCGDDKQLASTKTEKSSKCKMTDREEYARLREELRKSKKAVSLLMGDKAKKLEKDRAFQNMLTPLQQQRQKYLQRKKTSSRTAREQETLSKLKKFQTTLIDVNTTANTSKDVTNEAKEESYHGQVLECDDDDDNSNEDKSWMTAKLKFTKHIDDQFRAGHEPSTDDYMTIDTRTETAHGGSRKQKDRQHDRSHNRPQDERYNGYRDHNRRTHHRHRR